MKEIQIEFMQAFRAVLRNDRNERRKTFKSIVKASQISQETLVSEILKLAELAEEKQMENEAATLRMISVCCDIMQPSTVATLFKELAEQHKQI